MKKKKSLLAKENKLLISTQENKEELKVNVQFPMIV